MPSILAACVGNSAGLNRKGSEVLARGKHLFVQDYEHFLARLR